MSDEILIIVIKSGVFVPSSINEWFNEWSRDFFVEDYQCDIWYGNGAVKNTHLYVPVDQIRPEKFKMLKLEEEAGDRRYPDTTDNPSFAIIDTYLMRASQYHATNATYARAAKLS